MWSAALGAELVAMLKEGCWHVTAARAVGVCAKTVRNWLKLADAPEAADELVTWAAAYRAASAQAETGLVNVVAVAAAGGDVKAAQWMLEKRWSKRWKEPEKLELAGKDGGPVSVEVATAGLLAALRKLELGSGSGAPAAPVEPKP